MYEHILPLDVDNIKKEKKTYSTGIVKPLETLLLHEGGGINYYVTNPRLTGCNLVDDSLPAYRLEQLEPQKLLNFNLTKDTSGILTV